MNSANPYLQQYQKSQVETATPEEILILLYNGAINFLNKAKICLENQDEEMFHKNMEGCKNIIVEFMNTLDVKNGGDWAVTLYRLYQYLRRTLIKADYSKDINGLEEVLKHLTSLRATWTKAIEIAKEERASQESISAQGEDSAEITHINITEGSDENNEDDADDENEDEDEV